MTLIGVMGLKGLMLGCWGTSSSRAEGKEPPSGADRRTDINLSQIELGHVTSHISTRSGRTH